MDPRPPLLRRGRGRLAAAGAAALLALLPFVLRGQDSARDATARGEAKYAAGDYAGAAAEYKRALALSPEYVKACDGLAAAEAKQDNHGAAIAAAGRAIAADENDAVAYTIRGAVSARLGNLDAAQSDLNRALAIAPTYGPAYLNRGAVRLNQGDEEGARADLEQAVGLAPQKAASYVNRGWARALRGDLAGALADFDHAVSLEPSALRSFLNRGLVRAANDQAAGAVSDLRRCALDPRGTLPLAPLYLWAVRAPTERSAADKELAAFIPPATPGRLPEWREQLAAYVLGRLDEPAFLAAAAGPSPNSDSRPARLRRAQGWYFVGVRRRLAGESREAAAAFSQALAAGAHGSNEDFLARQALQTLLQPVTGAP